MVSLAEELQELHNDFDKKMVCLGININDLENKGLSSAIIKENFDICEFCGKLWNSEFHMSDSCININEDFDEFEHADNENDEKRFNNA